MIGSKAEVKPTFLGIISKLPEYVGRPAAKTSYIPQIDGLRFIAIAYVVLWHISLRADRFIDEINDAERNHLTSSPSGIPDLYGWFPHGEVGVALFFFISGFIIAQPFVSRPRDQWQVGRFYMRRLRRIYPPYLTAITLCFLILAVSGYRRLGDHLPLFKTYLASIFYVNGLVYNQSSPLDPPIWSLEIEAQFYLLAPLLLALYIRPRRLSRRVAMGSAVVLALIVSAGLVDYIRPFDGRFRFGLLAHMHLFISGIVVSDIVYSRNLLRIRTSPIFDLLFGFGLAAMYLLGLWLTGIDAKPGGGWNDILRDLALLAAVLAIYFGAMHGRVGRAVMGCPWICLGGTMCFSIYLTHVAVIQAVASLLLRRLPLHDAGSIYGAYMLVLLPALFTVSLAFYLCVERPFMTGYIPRFLPLLQYTRARRDVRSLPKSPTLDLCATGGSLNEQHG